MKLGKKHPWWTGRSVGPDSATAIRFPLSTRHNLNNFCLPNHEAPKKDASRSQGDPRADSQVLASGILTRLDVNKVPAGGRCELRARQVEETDYDS
jgi:hypothetical protein